MDPTFLIQIFPTISKKEFKQKFLQNYWKRGKIVLQVIINLDIDFTTISQTKFLNASKIQI